MKQKIKAKYLLFKRRIADALQRKSESLSLRSKKIMLFLFCSLFGCASITVIIHSITTKASVVSIQAKMPRVIHQKEEPVLPFISKNEFERIEVFKKQVYALPKVTFDSFMLARPKLMDSITQIENYYKSQNKK